MKKRRQHYVWKHYLSAWTSNDALFCLRDGKTFRTRPISVAVRKDFYRVRALSRADVAFLKAFVAKCPEESRLVLGGWIKWFDAFPTIDRAYRESGKTNLELEHELDVALQNLEEDFHSRLETTALPLLQNLRNDNVDFFSDPVAFADFVFFVNVQYFRTAKLQKSVVGALAELPVGMNAESLWPVLRILFSTNIAGVFIKCRTHARLTLLQAPSDTEFITGDQPVVNLRGNSTGQPVSDDDLELYYPVSPSRAILLRLDRTGWGVARMTLGVAQTNSYNRCLQEESLEQTYATRPEAFPESILDRGDV